MTVTVFVDTNVLIYAIDTGDAAKQRMAQRWRTELWKRRGGRISYQVLQEFYARVTQKRPGARQQAREEVRDLLSWAPISANVALLENAWQIQDRYRLSFGNALIVAAAKAASCQYLLTEDLPPGQDLDGVKVLSPFAHDPADILVD
jgi:predicted nucleic acid-binding protein